MFRGFLTGAVLGGSLSVLALVVTSLLGDQPAGNTPPAAPQIDAPNVIVSAIPAPDAPVEATAPDAGPTPPAAPGVVFAAPQTDAPLADTSPAPQPETGAITGNLMAPEAGTAAPLDLSSVAPVLPNPQSVAPQIPANEQDLTLSTDPAQPLPPEVAEDTGLDAAAGSPDENFIVLDPAAIQPPEFAESATTDSQPATPEPPAAEPAATETALADPETPLPEPTPATEPPTTSAGPAPRVGLSGELAGAMPSGTSAVQVRRPGTDTATAAETESAPPTENVPALIRYAAMSDSTETRPLMSLILIDDGSLPGGAEALVGLPMPVTIALDPGRAGAAEAMAGYRAKGIEVIAMAGIPVGAQPSDVEVAYAAAFAILPETIGVLDAGNGGLQGDRAATAQAMEILAADGRGLITGIRGLNEAARAAVRAEVPTANVYRDLDSQGQDARVIRRFLDQAAFQARRDSGVILLGRVRPDTISALILWGTANRDGQVAFAPVSAVLQAQGNSRSGG